MHGTKRLLIVVKDLSSARTLDEIMTLVRTAAREIVKSDGATFVLREKGFCYYADEDAISPLWKGQRFPADSCISGWAMNHKQAVTILDIEQDSRIPLDAYRPTFVKSLAMVPIRKDDPIGAIGVYWAHPHKTSEEELELIQALAETVSVAMENVKLYQDLNTKIKELERVNEAKDNFLLTISHELRTPLNATRGWVDLLIEDKLTERELQHALKILDKSVAAQTRVVNDLIDSTRIITGNLVLERKETDLIEIAKETLSAIEPEADRKSIILNFTTSLKKASIFADSSRIQQVLSKLIANSIKFSNHRTHIHLDISQKGPGVEIKITDQGIGFDAAELSHIFTPFYQSDSTTTRKYGGLGLGLYICKNLIEEHGGQIDIQSAGHDKGTTVTLLIPLIDKNRELLDAALREHGIPSSHKKLTGFNILAVDDDEDSLALIETVLRKSGAHVVKAGSVKEAIECSETSQFDVLVSDLSMPEEDGFSLVNKVRKGNTPLSRVIPAVAVTAFNDKDNEIKALHAGFDKFFGKPFSAPRLVESIQSLHPHQSR